MKSTSVLSPWALDIAQHQPPLSDNGLMRGRSSEFGGRCAPAYSWIFTNTSWGVSPFLSWHNNTSFPMENISSCYSLKTSNAWIHFKTFFLCPCLHSVFQPSWKESFQVLEMWGQEGFSYLWETAVVYKFTSEDGRDERCSSPVSTDTTGPSSLLFSQHYCCATAFPSCYRALELKNSVMSLGLSFDRTWTKGLDYL